MTKQPTAEPNGKTEPQATAGVAVGRRDFLKTTALLGGSALLGQAAHSLAGLAADAPGDYPLAKAENTIFTVCQQCNTQCGIKVKLVNGVAAKIDGNPYSPMTLYPHLAYTTPQGQAVPVDAGICPKGQAGIQSAYDPYRIRVVLKRKPGTARGAGQWVTVPFDQACQEIVNGGDLFGEGKVEGLKELWAIRDPKVLTDMATAVAAITAEKDAAKKKALVGEFKTKFAAHLDKLIDPEHPDLGPKNNQITFMWGRLKGGRNDWINRFTRDGLGSTNTHGHTTVCQGSLYFSGKAMSEQFVEGKFSGGEKFYWQADLGNSEFVIFVGASPFEANYGPPLRVTKITEGLVSGRMRYAVIDPRLSKTAAKAYKWLPNKPGSEGAIAMAMIRWIIENKRYDEKFLRAANKAAATAIKEASFVNATWLVRIGDDGVPGALVRATEVGLAKKGEAEKDGKKVTVYTVEGRDYTFDPVVALVDGKPVAFDPNDEKTAVVGDLFVDTSLSAPDSKSVRVKSGLQLLKESAEQMTIEAYAAEAGLKASDIVELAREFTSHGKKAVVDIHRGVSQHTNGFYNVVAWYTLSALIGNYDWQGGLIRVSTQDYSGGKAGKPFNLSKFTPSKLTPFGISIIRHDVKWQDTTLFDGQYPAKRQWYPLASDIYQELIPSMGDAYPYPIKALFIYQGTPVYSLPAGNTNIEILKDPKKLPLVICSDIVVGETSMYADYIFPDLTYLERWEMAGSHPSVPWKIQPVRQPSIAPLVETVKVYGQDMPISLESMILGLAEQLGLPNFGPDGLDKGVPLTHMDHFYLRMIANLGFGEKEDGSDAVPDADDAEVQTFLAARQHLPKTVFDPERWKAIVGEANWRKVVYVLNRGGRFQDFAKGYSGQQVANKYGKLICLYQEKTAGVKSAMTGKALVGYATYIPGPLDVTGKALDDEKNGYPFILTTFKEITSTKSRTVSNYWLRAVNPENEVLMNAQDAARLGLRDGDKVKLVSPTNPEGVWNLGNGEQKPVLGKLKVVQGLRPGVLTFSLGHGHWAYGASNFTVDGQVVEGDARRAMGFHANAVMRVDPYLKNTCLVDPIGASAVFYDSRVNVVKV
ncbi:MAG: molybdopterin-dependent oxidoreductase [Anaerolineae bacterium]|nr:molybdopterin-dependent oxidoreductase [Anaerolineae bacterium]